MADLEGADLVESRVEEFIRNRKSVLSEREVNLAKSMLDQPIGAVTDPHHKSPEVFKIHEKEDDYFNRMGDLEQERLYTSLHDQNQRLKKHIKELKKEFYTLLHTYDAVNGLDMKTLEKQNKELREELRDLTFKKDKVNAVKPETVKAKKQLLKAYGQPDVSQTSPGTVTYVDLEIILPDRQKAGRSQDR